MTYAAVITAGGRVPQEFAQQIGTPVKALAPFAGSTFLQRTIDALRGIGVERIAVVGGSEVREACASTVERIIDERASGAENLRLALRAWDAHTPLLYLTSDMPFITAAALQTFVGSAPPEAIALPLTEWADFVQRFPGAPPFGITLGGEKVVNGGAFIIPANAQQRIEAFAARMFDARKNAWAMAQIAGAGLLLRFAIRRLRIGHLEARAQQLVGIGARAVRRSPAELAYDVDTLEEYRYAVANA